jgi:hypothetical protein
MYQLFDENENKVELNQILQLRDIRGLYNDDTDEELNIGDLFYVVAKFQEGEYNQAELRSLKTKEIHIFDVDRCVLIEAPNITKNEMNDLIVYHSRILQNLNYLGGYALENKIESLPPHIFRRRLLSLEIDLKRTLENVQTARRLAKNL